jgi:beta-fructofuranosidase
MKQTALEMQNRVRQRITEQKEMVASDPYRLHYHLMPPVGLLNDPNGLIFYKGKYHVFYQWNPFQTTHGVKFWGHYQSEDLVHWEDLGVALSPDSWYDKNGCYSGSAIIHEGKLFLFYTGNVKDKEGNRKSYQCLAISDDGVTFEKKGPIIPDIPKGYTAHFRDPKVFKKHDKWYMVLGAQTKLEKGEVVLYSSRNLFDWDFLGALAGCGRNNLDSDFGYMWECPDFVTIDGQDVLLVCPQGLEPKGFQYQNIFQSGYFVGEAELELPSFQHGEFVELDCGFDFYASQTTVDEKGRVLLFAWMGNAEEEGVIQPTVQHHWIHALTIPRELKYTDGTLRQYPVEELRLLRGEKNHFSGVLPREFDKFTGAVFELLMEVKQWGTNHFSLEIGKSIVLEYEHGKQILTLKRKHDNQPLNWETRQCSLEELTMLHIFKDTSSIELFINNGEKVFTSRVFDMSGDDAIRIMVNGSVEAEVTKWDLKRITAY